MGPEFDFDQHASTEHDIWNYLYFFLYLQNMHKKDQGNGFNGAESEIWGKIESNEASWLPSRSSWSIQEHSRSKAKQEGGSEVERTVAKLGTQMSAMRGDMDERFTEARAAMKDMADSLRAIKRNTSERGAAAGHT
jgi:hypothetical protein